MVDSGKNRRTHNTHAVGYNNDRKSPVRLTPAGRFLVSILIVTAIIVVMGIAGFIEQGGLP